MKLSKDKAPALFSPRGSGPVSLSSWVQISPYKSKQYIHILPFDIKFNIMATYSDSDFNSAHYQSARPSYPAAFYKTLLDYHQKGPASTDLAVDVGCGSGFVTFKLVEFFNHVIGTDISTVMISQCKNDERTKNLEGKISFVVAPGEKAPQEISPQSVDMVTGAECCHWMDHDKFFKECARILKPGATLAYWFYLDPIFVGQPEANRIYTDFTYGSSVEKHNDSYERFVGPFYEQPGHEYLRTAMAEVSPPSELFYDVVRHHYNPLVHDENYTTLFIKRRITLNIYKDYVTSWSGYHNWKKVHGDKPDAAEEFIQNLAHAMAVDLETPVDIIFPTVYTFARRR